MSTTYLDLINNVLRRLRERVVSTANESSYSTLVGIFVNDAREEVENAWQWSGLRENISITTAASTVSYDLPNTRSRFTLLSVTNTTSKTKLQYRDPAWFIDKTVLNTPETGSPLYYTFDSVASDGDTQVKLYPTPDGAYNIDFYTDLRDLDLSADTDVLVVPHRPVQLLAYAKAIEERGEDGGVQSGSAFFIASRSLSDSIVFDAAKHPEDTIWLSNQIESTNNNLWY